MDRILMFLDLLSIITLVYLLVSIIRGVSGNIESQKRVDGDLALASVMAALWIVTTGIV